MSAEYRITVTLEEVSRYGGTVEMHKCGESFDRYTEAESAYEDVHRALTGAAPTKLGFRVGPNGIGMRVHRDLSVDR